MAFASEHCTSMVLRLSSPMPHRGSRKGGAPREWFSEPSNKEFGGRFMQTTDATSLRDIEDAVASVFGKDNACFRGQSSAGWDLVPSAYRSLVPLSNDRDFKPIEVTDVERDTCREFDIQAERSIPRNFDILERLSIAQHHGVPTRLLDWTTNIAVATFFAAFGGSQGDFAVWALNLKRFPFPQSLGRQHRGGGFNLAKINNYGRGVIASFAKPVSEPVDFGPAKSRTKTKTQIPKGTFVVWKPARVDERLQRQNGLLSWYHSFEDRDLVWNYSDHISKLESGDKGLLLKITVPGAKRADVQEEILRRGIDDHYLFPDLDGLGKGLARQHHQSMTDYLQQ
jgi:hypothetical protein